MPDHQTPILKVVHEIVEVIDNNPLSREKLRDLVPAILVSRNKIQALFKTEKGTSITKYRLQKRMEAAAGILEEDKTITIQLVAYKCGYGGRNGASNFSRDFKKIYKTTPAEYQANEKQSTRPLQ